MTIAGRAVSSLIHTQGIGDLYRIYATTLALTRLLRRYTGEVSSVVDAAAAVVPRDLGVRAQRSSANGISVDDFCGPNLRWGFTSLHPSLQRPEPIEDVRAGATSAMTHAGQQKQTVEVLDVSARLCGG
jgi:hypothetical protein